MARGRSVYVCRQCGYEATGWLGRCPACGNWNCLEPVSVQKEEGDRKTVSPCPLTCIGGNEKGRFSTGLQEVDRVLGGGLVPGSLVLIGGDPGIGKSTLLLQVAGYLARTHGPVLYLSGEESAAQLRLRAERLRCLHENILICPHASLSQLEAYLAGGNKPVVIMVDSIQTATVDSSPAAPGSVAQVRECTLYLLQLAKKTEIPVLVVGHVTKEGLIAGPRVMEHMVDVVLYFEGERHHSLRLLRGVKNRFGSTSELGLFEMGEEGLVELSNPSRLFLAERPVGEPGSVVIPALEGTRPLLVELQALVVGAGAGPPRRMASGVDFNRLIMVLAVLEKRLGYRIGNQDAYINVVGGVKLLEPAADLGMAVALVSSFLERPVASDMVLLGEVGLAGEVRRVTEMERRLAEASRLGFTRAVVPAGGWKNRSLPAGEIEIIPVSTLREAIDFALGG
ncbi:MAG: hypothetical protein PWQ31_660 [Eubacteriales bacterium]|nr:hypothetical protein [Eubacteriales bacterium]